MEQDLAALIAEGATPASSPVAAETEIGKPKSDPDERIKGFQRLINERDEAHQRELETLKSQLEELRLASMSESERETHLSKQRDTEVERLRAELELTKLRAEYEDVFDPYQRLLNAKSAREQAEILRELRSPKTTSQATEEPVSDVDRNNPLNANFGYAEDDALDPDRAEDLLKRFGKLKLGAFRLG